MNVCGDYVIVKFYFSLQIFLSNVGSLSHFFPYNVLTLRHIKLYFVSNFLSLNKKKHGLGVIKFFRYAFIYLTHHDVTSSLFLFPTKYFELFCGIQVTLWSKKF